MKPRIRALIVDDEELARRGMQLRVQSHDDIEIVATCSNGREALNAVAEHSPDLIFLDVQMPGMSGFEVAANLAHAEMPLIVFVTAYDRYALEAFATQAVDYLLKPVEESRLAEALQRVRDTLSQHQALTRHERLLKLIAQVHGEQEIVHEELIEQLRSLSRDVQADATLDSQDIQSDRHALVIPIRTDKETVRLPVRDIDWIDAAGDYMCVHAQGRTYVLRETMKSLEGALDPERFPRIHRSTIVNAERVRRLRPHMNGEYFLTLDGGQELKLSRSYRDRIEKLLTKR